MAGVNVRPRSRMQDANARLFVTQDHPQRIYDVTTSQKRARRTRLQRRNRWPESRSTGLLSLRDSVIRSEPHESNLKRIPPTIR